MRRGHVRHVSQQVSNVTNNSSLGKTDDYLRAWLRICRNRPEVNFYAYTKEVRRFRRMVEPDPPPNFRWVYSCGGTQDHLLHPDTDRVADVFPDDAAIAGAGWSSQEASDLLAVLGPRLVGIPANRIPQFLRRLHGRRFSQWQREVDAERAARRHRIGPTPPTGTAGGDGATGQRPAAA